MAHMPIDYGPYASYSMENRLDIFLIYPFASMSWQIISTVISHTRVATALEVIPARSISHQGLFYIIYIKLYVIWQFNII